MKLRIGPLTLSTREPVQEAVVHDLVESDMRRLAPSFAVDDPPADAELLHTDPDKPIKVSTAPPKGGTGTRWLSSIGNTTEEYNPDLQGERGIAVYDKMYKSDAQIAAILRAMELPIIEADWTVEQASDDALDVEIAQFASDNLFGSGPGKPWEATLAEILTQYRFGHSVFEMYFVAGEDGKVRARLGFRPQKTIKEWRVNPDGSLLEIVQRIFKGTGFVEPVIKAPNVIVFTIQREGDNYTGVSLLRPAYKHWYYKDQLYRIDAIAGERSGMGVPFAMYPPGSLEKDIDAGAAVLSGLHAHQRQYAMFPTTWEWGLKGVEGSLRELMPSIEHHDKMIARSILASWLNLDQGDAQSHSADLSSLFLMSLHAVVKQIAATLETDVLRPLIDFNFSGVQRYPTIKVSGLDKRDIGANLAGIAGLITSGGLTMNAETENHLRMMLQIPGIDADERDEVIESMKPPEPLLVDPAQDIDNDSTDTGGTKTETKVELTHRRAPNPFEVLVNLSSVEEELTAARENIVQASAMPLRGYANSLARKAKGVIERGEHLEPDRISVKREDLAEVIAKVMTAQFEAGRTSVQREAKLQGVDVAAELQHPWDEPLTKVEEFVKQHALALAAVVISRMKATLSLLAAQQLGDDSYDASTLEAGILSAAVVDLKRNAGTVVNDSFSLGRAVEAKRLKANRAQYSALFDGDLCGPCYTLDGQFFEVGTSAYNSAMPPYRNCEGRDNCRCVYVYEFKSE